MIWRGSARSAESLLQVWWQLLPNFGLSAILPLFGKVRKAWLREAIIIAYGAENAWLARL